MLVDLVQTTTRDEFRLDGVYQAATTASTIGVDAFCLVHGTGSNFYGSSLLEAIAERLVKVGCGALRANTRGHDWLSIAAVGRGGRRQGAAYELVDDCRHDLAAWLGWLKQNAGPRVGLIGHSLGAVKSLYAAAHEAGLDVKCIVAVSPPRLSYATFCQSASAPEFLEAYQRAEQLVQAGEGATLIEVKHPLPLLITAAGYVEKYGPDERYNFLRFFRSPSCHTLFTFGGQEVANNMAFRGLPDDLAKVRDRNSRLQIATVPDADHFYSGKRAELWAEMEKWLTTVLL